MTHDPWADRTPQERHAAVRRKLAKAEQDLAYREGLLRVAELLVKDTRAEVEDLRERERREWRSLRGLRWAGNSIPLIDAEPEEQLDAGDEDRDEG